MSAATWRLAITRSLALFSFVAIQAVWAQHPTTQREEIEYQIKASYIYNILQFVIFPLDTFELENTVSVCVLGENRFGDSLPEIQNAKTPQGKIDIEYLGDYSQHVSLKSCNVIYIMDDEAANTKKILNAIDTANTLTISEYPLFIKDGGIIELFVKDDSIRFRINSRLARQARFQISAQLLELSVP